MDRILIVIIIVLLNMPTHSMAQRKKVGLVLGGGGAKGAAHVGVLKVLEDASIPIDYIAGTSIGAIVGGLYSIGYGVNELDSLFRNQDWMALIGDKTQWNHRSLPSKDVVDKYMFSISFADRQKIALPAGVVYGQNILKVFSDMTIGYHDVASFSDLPIPFSCVAIDLISGKEVVLNKGSLPLAMRSSMSIPGVFEPVEMNGMVLVDGGAVNNLPVNVVRDMGADIIIAVDLSVEQVAEDKVKTVFGIVDQLTDMMGEENYKRNKSNSDLYLNPILQGYSSASFTRKDIDTMIVRGEDIARDHWDELVALRSVIYNNTSDSIAIGVNRRVSYVVPDSICINTVQLSGISPQTERWVRKHIKIRDTSVVARGDVDKAVSMLYGTGLFTQVRFSLSANSPYDLHITMQEKPINNLNVGFRFDTEEMASILLNTSISHEVMRGATFTVTGRLSQNPYLDLSVHLGNGIAQRLSLGYTLHSNVFKLFRGDKRIDNLSFISQSAELKYSTMLRNLKCSMGLIYNYFSYDEKLYSPNYQPAIMRPEGIFSTIASLNYESYDNKYYPTKGCLSNVEGQLLIDDLTARRGSNPFASIVIDCRKAFSLTSRFCLLPSVQGRFLIGDNVPFIYQNYMGGSLNGRYLPQQIAFSGIRHIQVFENNIVAAKIALRYRIGTKHYLFAVGEYAKESDKFSSLLNGHDIWGTAVRYSFDTIIGPVGCEVNYSNVDKEMGGYLFLGYNF